MQIVLDRHRWTRYDGNKVELGGIHAGKAWIAISVGDKSQHVYGMVASSRDVYPGSGVYLPLYRGSQWCSVYSPNPAEVLHWLCHIHVPRAVWLWCRLGNTHTGNIGGNYFKPSAGDLCNQLPDEDRYTLGSLPWRVVVTKMCHVLCEAVQRDEYARGC